MFLVVICHEHRFEEVRIDVLGERLNLFFFLEVDEVGTVHGQRLILKVVDVVLEVLDVAFIDQDDFTVLHIFELLSIKQTIHRFICCSTRNCRDFECIPCYSI